MALCRSDVVGRILYGSLFAVILPLGLLAWAKATEGVVGLPAIQNVWVGCALSVLGLAFMVGASLSLWRDGGGLPMNAYPPPRFVDRAFTVFSPTPSTWVSWLFVQGFPWLPGPRAGCGW